MIVVSVIILVCNLFVVMWLFEVCNGMSEIDVGLFWLKYVFDVVELSVGMLCVFVFYEIFFKFLVEMVKIFIDIFWIDIFYDVVVVED